jgi:arylformamidase
MNGIVDFQGEKYQIDFDKGYDISIPYSSKSDQVNCFYAPLFSSEPVKMGTFVGSVIDGGPVNYRNVKINPHGNGTHTECVGHISPGFESVNEVLKSFHFFSTLISIYPTKREDGDRVIEKRTLENFLDDISTESLIIRTLPNADIKKTSHYSGTNPIYFSKEAMEYVVSKNIIHLLVDIPSVDREEDGGELLAHKTFWSGQRKAYCTITELIYVPDFVPDGQYFLNLQMASMELDAVPSRPTLYELKK